jgi:hypothetical protein
MTLKTRLCGMGRRLRLKRHWSEVSHRNIFGENDEYHLSIAIIGANVCPIESLDYE